jgi:hypothetical protein
MANGANAAARVSRISASNRLFISCVSDEFQKPKSPFPEFREQLRHYLTRAECEVKVQEDFRQDGQVTTLEKLADYIKRDDTHKCAAVIHLVGEMPGAVPDPKEVPALLANLKSRGAEFLAGHPDLRAALGDLSDLTYTQWEAFLALHFGVPLFVYATARGRTAQETHLQCLQMAGKYPGTKLIEGPADLLGQLIGDLRYIIPDIGKVVQRLAPPRFLHHTAEFFLGREHELALLDRAWSEGTHVLSIIAWGGVGKTALLSEWIQTRFIDRHWLDKDGQPSPHAYFDWSFYDQGTRASADDRAVRSGSVGDFFEQALAHFDDPDVTRPGKGERLAKYVRQQRTLFILDGLEPLQQPVGSPTAGQLLDPDLRDFVTLLAQSNPGLCLLTSRQAITDLDGLRGVAAQQKDLDELPKTVAVRLLRKLQIAGTDQELEEASEKFDCHALSLTLLGRFLFDAHPIYVDDATGQKKVRQGDIRRIDRIRDLRRADTLTREERHRTIWKVLEAYDDWLAQAQGDGNPQTLAVLRLTGLFDRTATADCVAALRAEPVIPGITDAVVNIPEDEWNILLRRLERAHLIKLRLEPDDRLAIDAHPLIREYFAKQLRDRQPAAFQAAHSRLFDHLCERTPHRPDTLDGLQPLYQAVVHGCLAGRQQEACDKVYTDRILRGTGRDGFYSSSKLGAIGADLAAAVAFFDEPWGRVSPNLREAVQAWLLNEAAFLLRALGRLTEALQLMRAGLEMSVQQHAWKHAAANAGNLCELDVTLGRLTDAVADGRLSIAYAGQSGDVFQKLSKRATAADVLHQSGQRAEAGTLFAEAEQMQQQRGQKFDMLYSLSGFRYGDWLLAPAERAAWQAVQGGQGRRSWTDNEDCDRHAAACTEVERRANTVFAWRRDTIWNPNADPLLDIALDHLTLARVGLVRAILVAPLPQPALDLPHVAAAVNGLRAAGQLDDLPKGLLTAALYHFVRGEEAAARAALDEAQEIAARGPMPLYLADIHLHRARLFRDRAELAQARTLIDKHGYGRRLEELADAEAAANAWPA